jgi:hypothetical protein
MGDGSLGRIGLDRTNGFGYVTVYNTAWGDIENGKTHPIDLALDGEHTTGKGKETTLGNSLFYTFQL